MTPDGLSSATFSAGYSISEDRLLLHVITSGAQAGIWLTRRGTLTLAKAINQTLESLYAMDSSLAAAKSHLPEIAEFGQRAASGEFPIKGQKALCANVGLTTVLYEVRFKAVDATTAFFYLLDIHGAGFSLTLQRPMLHALLNLLQSQTKYAGWNVDLIPSAAFLIDQNTNSLTPLLH